MAALLSRIVSSSAMVYPLTVPKVASYAMIELAATVPAKVAFPLASIATALCHTPASSL